MDPEALSPPSPPPEDLFCSREAAQDELQQWAKKHTFAVVFNRLRKNVKGEHYKQWVNCSKYGTFKTEGMVCERLQAERRTVNGRHSLSVYQTLLPGRYRVYTPILYRESLTMYGIVTKPVHNHPIPLSSIAFPQHRQFDQETSKQVKDLSAAGLRPSLIESVLL